MHKKSPLAKFESEVEFDGKPISSLNINSWFVKPNSNKFDVGVSNVS